MFNIFTALLLGLSTLDLLSSANGERTKSSYESYYDEKYFSWQLQHHNYSAISIQKDPNGPSLHGKLSADSTVLDFGCSAGMVLNALVGKKKVCVELNNHARDYACKHHPQHTCYQYPEQVPSGTIDVVYTQSVLEHCEAPIRELRYLWHALKPGGLIVVGLVNDGRMKNQKWGDPDINNHLYTWNSMLLGNMLRASCFEQINVTTDRNAYPPNYTKIRKNYNNEEWAKLIAAEGEKRGHENLHAVARRPVGAVQCLG